MTAARRSTSRCSATAASTTRAGLRSPTTACRGWWRELCLRSRTTSGSSTTRTRTGARRTTSPPRCRRSWPSCNSCWLEEARKYNVLPLDDRRIERFNAELVGRPELVKGNSQLLFGGMGRLSENSVLNIKNKSHAVTAEVVVPEAGAEGVIFAQGGAFAGWSLYAKDWAPDLLLQPARPAALQGRGRRCDPARNAPGADGVRLRRRRSRQGRHRDALPRRRQDRGRPRRAQPCR